MDNLKKLAQLRSLYARFEAIRQELGFSPPGQIIYIASLNVCPDDSVLVEADGFGGATTSVVAGNYPVDYMTKFERFFERESDAQTAAEELSSHRTSPGQILEALE